MKHSKNEQGAALVIVLSLLVMLTVLMIVFFMAVEVDTQSTSVNRNLGTLHQLSDLPLQIVQTQIRAATTLGQTGTDPVNTWTSQPGLLRVFSNTGDFVRAYKLYSSSIMDTDQLSFIGNEISDDWPNLPNRWVNLNEPFLAVTQGNRKIWPILNPDAVSWAEGLTVGADPAGETNATMPVEWLYVLEDGSVVAQNHISAENPPVGRIAFWTDDESCKININTAGERTMWDRPLFDHQNRKQFARNQPSTGEYNAYPGHPSTVSLSAVFGKALGEDASGSNHSEIVESMLALTPRYRWGGSEDGSLSIWDTRKELDRTKSIANNKNDRLYATPSEFLLNATRHIQDERLKIPIRESGFLLTESSRAPEINAFGLPRIAIWPIDTNPAHRTVYDDLIAHASTIGDKGYYFQRTSPIARNEAEAINRNWELMQYLDRLTKKDSSGFSNATTATVSFENKWGTDERRQILTEIFDYIRVANLSDTSRPPAEYDKQFTPAKQEDRGVVLPTRINTWNTRGAGRVPILDRIGLIFYAVKQTVDADNNPDQTEMRCMVWFNFFSPAYGLAPHAMRIRVRLTNFKAAVADKVSKTFHDFHLIGNQRDFTFPNPQSIYDWGGPEDMIGNYRGNGLYFTGSGKNITYEFISSNLITLQGDHMDFQGGTWTLEVFDQREPGQPLQTYQLNFPDASDWPVPTLYDARTDGVELAERYKASEGSTGQDSIIGRRKMGEPPCDVIRAIEPRDGDHRIIACLETIPSTFFQPGYGYFSSSIKLGGHLRYTRRSVLLEGGADNSGTGTPANSYSGLGRHVDVNMSTSSKGGNFAIPSLPHAVDGQQLNSLRSVRWVGDFDNAFFKEADGAYLNKPDEGHLIPEPNGTLQPYEVNDSTANWDDGTQSKWDPAINGFFSPTRQIPSPVMFGSLPTGVRHSLAAYESNQPHHARPWETLLFCPNSLAATVADGDGNIGHPGSQSPQDHLLLDLFTMPVVEPYAITEPFSTAGKINMNQRIIPFQYIKRETGLWGVLKNLEIASFASAGKATTTSAKVDIPATLQQMATILDPSGNVGRGVFRSASEICDIFLVPSNLGSQTLTKYWQDHQRTGNNTREAPYNYIYPLLTTKSNTYQVHYRVQTLKPLTKKATYDPVNDFVVEGEQRGSYVIERYLDVNDPHFSGNTPTIDTDTTSLNEFYKFRTLRHNRFTPGS